jgi:hypothetical protein
MLVEMRRRAEHNQIEHEWSRETRALSEWAANQPTLSKRPHRPKGIAGRKELREEHRKLTGQAS